MAEPTDESFELDLCKERLFYHQQSLKRLCSDLLDIDAPQAVKDRLTALLDSVMKELEENEEARKAEILLIKDNGARYSLQAYFSSPGDGDGEEGTVVAEASTTAVPGDGGQRKADYMTRLELHKAEQRLQDSIRHVHICRKELERVKESLEKQGDKMKMMTRQTDQLREDLSFKEGQVLSQISITSQLQREIERNKMEMSKLKTEIKRRDDKIFDDDMERESLRRHAAHLEAELQSKLMKYEQGAQAHSMLEKYNSDLKERVRDLEEKLKTLDSLFQSASRQYSARVNDIQLLRLEIMRLRQEKSVDQDQLANLQDMRAQLRHVQQEWVGMQTKCKALEEELENPRNIHRWRNLKGSDPSQYELMRKLQHLQGRLLLKSKELAATEQRLEDITKEFEALKCVLARRPGAEVSTQLALSKRNGLSKTREIKALRAELNLFLTNEKRRKDEMSDMTKELNKMKRICKQFCDPAGILPAIPENETVTPQQQHVSGHAALEDYPHDESPSCTQTSSLVSANYPSTPHHN